MPYDLHITGQSLSLQGPEYQRRRNLHGDRKCKGLMDLLTKLAFQS